MDQSVEQEGKKKSNKALCKGLCVGGAIALSIVFAKKEWRQRFISELNHVKEGTTEAVGFIRENREQIVGQVKSTITEVSTVVREISEDVKQLSQTASHLKESTEEIVKATRDAASEMKSLKKSED